MSQVRVGGHVDRDDPAAGAAAIGADCVQIFLSDPQSWKKPDLGADAVAVLSDSLQNADVDLYIHAPYVINVATMNNRIRIPSRKLLQQHVNLAAQVGARGVVVHGGHVSQGDDPGVGFDNWRKAVDQLDFACPVFIENTAGGNFAMARRLEALERLWDSVGHSEIGFCLDTCHAWAGGIGVPEVVEQVRAITGRIDLVHANDSEGDFDSGRDRHRNFGEGTLGEYRILECIAAAAAPVICETPAPGIAGDIAAIREHLGQ